MWSDSAEKVFTVAGPGLGRERWPRIREREMAQDLGERDGPGLGERDGPGLGRERWPRTRRERCPREIADASSS